MQPYKRVVHVFFYRVSGLKDEVFGNDATLVDTLLKGSIMQFNLKDIQDIENPETRNKLAAIKGWQATFLVFLLLKEWMAMKAQLTLLKAKIGLTRTWWLIEDFLYGR